MKVIRVGFVVLVVVLVATPVVAHVPLFPGDNISPEQAVVVPDPAKSWSFYDTVESGQVTYYRLSLEAGQRLRVGTFTPEASQFTPSIVLMSPSLNQTDPVPPSVIVPDGMGTLVVDGTRPQSATYEPFAPSANYHTATITRPVDAETTYVVAIYEPTNRSGPVGVAIGYKEAFSPTEYVTVPFDLVRTHLWEGQSPFVVVGPIVLTLLGGVGLVRTRHEDWEQPRVRYGVGAAGAVILGSGVNTVVQMGIASTTTDPTLGALVTAVFVVVPVICGGWVVWRVLRPEFTLTGTTRAGLAVAGTAAVATWAGFIVGPAILLVVAATPSRLIRS